MYGSKSTKLHDLVVIAFSISFPELDLPFGPDGVYTPRADPTR